MVGSANTSVCLYLSDLLELETGYKTVVSDVMDIEYGVTQPPGSLLGWLLFIVYMNDLPQKLRNGRVVHICR